ncbi:MAG: DUF4105 domain-containing protein [Bacteroidales bacterium]|jgi:hypothetical protein|nr:DUF4105 domain-containing protein [Bacteroidales bacterium]
MRTRFFRISLSVVLAAWSCVWCCSAADIRYPDINSTEISLLTAAPGEELYAAFGHSAVRVKDTISGLDAVFNYGMFDFNQPGFYTNFAQGRMNYCLGVQSFGQFVSTYARENRPVRELVFALDSAQKDHMIRFLFRNAQPENRNYLYHFFLDNCATRIRDLLNLTCEGLVLPVSQKKSTYRALVYQYTNNHPWGRFGIDVALGLPTDRSTDMFAQMFLPDYLEDAFAKATCSGQSLVRDTRNVVTPEQPLQVQAGWLTPSLTGWMLLVLALAFRFIRKSAKLFDFLLFFTVGLTGLLVTFLWFFTDHTNTHGNLNIIWALPTHSVMAFLLILRKQNNFTRKYFLATAVIAVLLLLAWAFLPQHLNTALIPVTIAIAVRAYSISTTK